MFNRLLTFRVFFETITQWKNTQIHTDTHSSVHTQPYTAAYSHQIEGTKPTEGRANITKFEAPPCFRAWFKELHGSAVEREKREEKETGKLLNSDQLVLFLWPLRAEDERTRIHGPAFGFLGVQ